MGESNDDTGDRQPLLSAATAELVRQFELPLGPGLYIVATPIGNLGDITLRALAVLARADVVYCEDTRHSRTLLSHFGIARPLRAYHEHNAEAERPRILDAMAAGRIVALVSDAGTPLVSDPGYKLVRAAAERGLTVAALPGASALLASLVVAGLPSDTVLFGGFLPSKEGAREERLRALLAVPATLVLFEAPGRLAKSLATIAALARGREVAVARELTKRFEELRRGTAAELALWAGEGEVRGEIVILVAPPAPPAEATDEAIAAALRPLLAHERVKDAARMVADDLGIARSRAYAIALELKSGEPS